MRGAQSHLLQDIERRCTALVTIQTLRAFADRLKYLRNLNDEKAKVEKAITEQGKWTDEIAKALADAKTMTEVEDIYRPYKPKRKTRASVAIAKGLEGLADILQAQSKSFVIMEEAKKYINEQVANENEAIAGAKDIVAERISDDAELRKELRTLLETRVLSLALWWRMRIVQLTRHTLDLSRKSKQFQATEYLR